MHYSAKSLRKEQRLGLIIEPDKVGSQLTPIESRKMADARRLLVNRVAASRYINRSARLRDLLLYLAERVVEDDIAEIHEQEVGHRVFGRPRDYDTTSDNIVRVHASTLRKRLEHYFASEGAEETVILEIPKGNYAPVFRRREEAEAAPVVTESLVREARQPVDWRLGVLATLALVFASSTAYLLASRKGTAGSSPLATRPAVRLFWSQVFRPGHPTDLVLDDAAVGLYQELTGRPLALSSYFDRTYLRSLPETAAAAKLDEQTASSIVLRRQSSVAGASFLWKLFQLNGAVAQPAVLRFARDYSFRELKANNAILLGNSRANPWVEPFESKLGLRWEYDKATGTYYPMDRWAHDKKYQSAPGDSREGYCAVSLVPNLGQSGNVLIIAGTGGSAMSAATDFLGSEDAVAALRRALPAASGDRFPYFEALIRVKRRSSVPHDATLVVCRPPKG
jgi:hypothetical protein